MSLVHHEDSLLNRTFDCTWDAFRYQLLHEKACEMRDLAIRARRLQHALDFIIEYEEPKTGGWEILKNDDDIHILQA